MLGIIERVRRVPAGLVCFAVADNYITLIIDCARSPLLDDRQHSGRPLIAAIAFLTLRARQ